MRIRNFALLLCAISVLLCVAGCNGKKVDNKPKTFKVEHFDKSRGLASENITGIAGIGNTIVAGSDKGLLLFDGVNWGIQCVKNNKIIGSDDVVSLQKYGGKIWIGTDNAACSYDGMNFSSINYGSGRARAVIGNGTETAVATARGVISNGRTISNSGGGLVSDEVTTLCFDNMGQLWVGTRAGISKIAGTFAANYTGPAKMVSGNSLMNVPASPSSCKLPGNYIKAMIPYRGMFAIGTTEGLCITDMTSFYENHTARHKEWAQVGGQIVDEFVSGNSKIPGNKIIALATTEQNELLFVATDEGLGILKGSEWLNVSSLIPELPSVSISSLAWHNGDLWIGTVDDGIYCVKALAPLFETEKEASEN